MKFDKSKLSLENYIQEVVEALITLIILKIFIAYIHKNPKIADVFTISFIVITSLIIGVITMCIETISPDLKDNIKQGIGFSAGVIMLSGGV